jgi:hypothetical protein
MGAPNPARYFSYPSHPKGNPESEQREDRSNDKDSDTYRQSLPDRWIARHPGIMQDPGEVHDLGSHVYGLESGKNPRDR